MELCDKYDVMLDVQKRMMIMNSENCQELLNSDVIILHDSHDLPILDLIKLPSIFFCHRAARPMTFMFDEIIKMVEPIRRAIILKDRTWVLSKIKEWFQKPDVVLANSKFIQEEIKKWFDRDAFVLSPPIDLRHFHPTTNSSPTKDFFLSVQRINWQKRLTVQIEAFKGLNEELKIVGSPRDKTPNLNLLKLVEDVDNIEVLGGVSETRLLNLYSNAKAVIQTGYYEDFGLVPIESMACGTPCIVVDEGAFKETVHSPELGIRIEKPYTENLRKTIKNFNLENYDSKTLREEAKKYGLSRFTTEMKKYIKLAVKNHGLRT